MVYYIFSFMYVTNAQTDTQNETFVQSRRVPFGNIFDGEKTNEDKIGDECVIHNI